MEVYVDWYYLRFLYHHNEQFLDLYDMINGYRNSDSDSITDEIRSYFQLPFTQVRNDEIFFNSLSMEEIVEKAQTGVSRDTLVNAERIISNRYSANLDMLLLIDHLFRNNTLDSDRLDRSLSHCGEQDRSVVYDALVRAYPSCGLHSRAALLNYIESSDPAIHWSRKTYFDTVYQKTEKDVIYYAERIQKINMQYRGSSRD